MYYLSIFMLKLWQHENDCYSSCLIFFRFLVGRNWSWRTTEMVEFIWVLVNVSKIYFDFYVMRVSNFVVWKLIVTVVLFRNLNRIFLWDSPFFFHTFDELFNKLSNQIINDRLIHNVCHILCFWLLKSQICFFLCVRIWDLDLDTWKFCLVYLSTTCSMKCLREQYWDKLAVRFKLL